MRQTSNELDSSRYDGSIHSDVVQLNRRRMFDHVALRNVVESAIDHTHARNLAPFKSANVEAVLALLARYPKQLDVPDHRHELPVCAFFVKQINGEHRFDQLADCHVPHVDVLE